MTNFEFYKDEILKIITKDDTGVSIVNNKPVPCANVLNCEGCAFIGSSCNSGLTKWLYAEHVENPKLTKKEKAFLEICKPDYYMARDNIGSLYIYSAKPYKNDLLSLWNIENGHSRRLDSGVAGWEGITYFLTIENNPFLFIKYEDEEPWKVEDLLKLEVV